MTAGSAGPTVGRPARPGPVVPSPAPGERDPWFDNLRCVAAVLVVVGHVVEQVAAGPVVDVLWSATWPYRIPLYAFVAGWFSVGPGPLRRRLGHALVDVGLVYLMLDLLGSVQAWSNGAPFVVDPSLPGPPGLWFLLALLIWRLVLPLVLLLPHPILWATVASVLGGMFAWSGPTWSVGRALGLFPVFLLGALARRGDLVAAARLLEPVRTRALPAAVVLGAVLAVTYSQVERRAFAMRDVYPGDLADRLGAVGERAFLLVLAVVGVLVVVAIVPRRHVRVMTYVGSGSMFVYVLHLFLLADPRVREVLRAADSWGEQLAAAVGAVVVALLLASPPVRALTRPLVQPRRALAAWQGKA